LEGGALPLRDEIEADALQRAQRVAAHVVDAAVEQPQRGRVGLRGGKDRGEDAGADHGAPLVPFTWCDVVRRAPGSPPRAGRATIPPGAVGGVQRAAGARVPRPPPRGYIPACDCSRSPTTRCGARPAW